MSNTTAAQLRQDAHAAHLAAKAAAVPPTPDYIAAKAALLAKIKEKKA